nr:reverse transcriptase domain-containing protein [Tanacetum cinerariifolium]
MEDSFVGTAFEDQQKEDKNTGTSTVEDFNLDNDIGKYLMMTGKEQYEEENTNMKIRRTRLKQLGGNCNSSPRTRSSLDNSGKCPTSGFPGLLQAFWARPRKDMCHQMCYALSISQVMSYAVMHSMVSSSAKIPIVWKSCLWSRNLLSSHAIQRINTNRVISAIGSLERRGYSASHTFQANAMQTEEGERRFPPQNQQSQPGKEYLMNPRPLFANPHSTIKGKVVLVAGGDSGIGRSVCYHFAKEGATIAFTYVKGDEDIDAKDTLAIINESKMEGSGVPVAIPTDLRYDINCKNVVDEVIAKYGGLDVLVNLPAVQYYTYTYTLEEITEERLEKVKLQNAIAARKLKEEYRKWRSRFRFGLTGPDYALKFVKGKSSKPFGRLWRDEIVSTVVTRPQPHNQAILHRVQGRVLTIRENARLQGFPDYYKLFGPVRERKNQNRFNQNQNRGNNFNHGPVYQPPVFQPLAYQAFAYQALAPQTQGVSKEDFLAYVKANDAVMRNMQTQGQNMQNQLTKLTELLTKFVNTNNASTSSSGTLPSNTIANPRNDLKAITIRSVHPTNNGSTEDVLHPVVQSKSLILTSKPVNSPTIEPVISLISTPRPNLRPSIPYPSRMQDQKLRSKANNNHEKIFQIFKDLNFNISFVDALILMLKFGPSIKSLLTNKDKLCEHVRTPLNKHCLAVLLKKLPEKLGDPGKFLIPCDFPGKAECLALADLDASINLMPLSVWNKLSLLDLSPTCMTLELADRSISCPVGVAEDVYVKVGTFHFPADFVVVDFDADPRVPLILRRSFLKTGRALIDVFEGELTLRVGKEAITFNLDQTSRYSANYNDMMAKRIDVIDMACEEYSQEVLGFFDVIASGNPTPYYDPIVSTTSSTLTPFGNSDFLLEEVDAFLALEDDLTSPKVDQSYIDSEGDILLLEAFLNDDPSLPPPNQGNYLPEVCKELKISKAKSNKSPIDEPLEVELKDLPPYLEYAFLEGDDKLPVIIAKDLSMEEKTALITVLKSHKRAIAWKLYDIKGIDLEFYTHKILMEEDFEPAVQHQRRVNPKIHDVIKQEVLKLLDVGLIYPISDSP